LTDLVLQDSKFTFFDLAKPSIY